MFPNNYDDLRDITSLVSTEKYLNKYGDIFSLNYSSFEPDITNTLLMSTGHILSKRSDTSYLVFMPLLNKGGSGAPVLSTDDNRVVGMILNKILTNTFEYTGVANVLPADKINQLLRSYIQLNAINSTK
jgi:hypothetical protein